MITCVDYSTRDQAAQIRPCYHALQSMSILAILLLGFALRAAPLLQHRFHPD